MGASTRQRMQMLIEKISRACPYAEIYIESILPVSYEKEKTKGSNNDIEMYNKNLEEYCDLNGVTYIDIWNSYHVNGRLNPNLFEDGLHISDYSLWYKCLEKYLD